MLFILMITEVKIECSMLLSQEQAAKEAAKNVEGTRKFSAESAAAAAQIRKVGF